MDHAINILKETNSSARQAEATLRGIGKIEVAAEIRAKSEELQFAIAALDCIRNGSLKQPETFEEKIAAAINSHSLEAGSDTPDFILAEYLKRCLENFDLTMQHRATWFEPSDGAEDVVPPAEAPKQEYRMLKGDDVIQKGDECKTLGRGWVPTPEIGIRVGEQYEGAYRRPL